MPLREHMLERWSPKQFLAPPFLEIQCHQIHPLKMHLCSCHFSTCKTLMDKVLPLNIPGFLSILQLLSEPTAHLVGVCPPNPSLSSSLFLIKGFILSHYPGSCSSLIEPPKMTVLSVATSSIHLGLWPAPPLDHSLSGACLWIPSMMLSSHVAFLYGVQLCLYALKSFSHHFSTLLCIKWAGPF